MTTKRFCAVLLAIGLVMITSEWAVAQAPGTPGAVTWSANHPKANKAPNPGGIGSVEVKGDYTVNMGWTASKAWFSYTPVAGGVPNNQLLFLGPTTVGAMGMGANVNSAIFQLPAGNYQGLITVEYKNGMGQVVNVITTVVQFII